MKNILLITEPRTGSSSLMKSIASAYGFDYQFEPDKKNKLIILISIICSFVFCTYSHFKQTQFLAELTFVVEKDASVENFGSASSLIKNFGFDLGGSSSTFSKNNIIELLKSRLVINKALMKKYGIKSRIIHIFF